MRRVERSLLWPAVLVTGALPLLAAIDPVLHYADLAPGADPWADWPLNPVITLGTVALAVIYIAGRQPAAGSRATAPRHLAFFAGLAAVFLALQIEEIADHIFIIHQVEHMLLGTVGPMLLLGAMPQAALLRGLPDWARRRIVTPLFGGRLARGLGIFGHPLAATALFIGTSYFWMIPHYHDLAILDEPIHYLWHASLLLCGIIFFWRVFDPRPSPPGATIATRLYMLGFAMLGDIVLGAYLSFKPVVLYSAYAEMGRIWPINPLTDERIGGLTMWVPGSMMMAMAALLMIYRSAGQEARSEARRRVAVGPTTVQRRRAVRATATGLLGFAAAMLVITFAVAILYHRFAGRPGITTF
jgi:putative membrane protein